MRLLQQADWVGEVLPAWQIAAGARSMPNAPVSEALPPGLVWWRAKVEASDIPLMHLLGALDWELAYGTYRLPRVAQRRSTRDDLFCHEQRIAQLQIALDAGADMAALHVVAPAVGGPYVLVDGNHRAVALLRHGALVDQPVYLGVHPQIEEAFTWYAHSVQGSAGGT